MKEKIPLKDLYFGIMVPKSSYTKKEDRNTLEQSNLFCRSRVKWAVAKWVLMPEEERKTHNFLTWCFFDTRWRAEYEFIVCPWPYTEDDTIKNTGLKVDTWTLYVEPNAKLLKELVDRVSQSSARAYLAEERKRFKR